MKDYLFTEFISLQWRTFFTMVFTGGVVGALYKSLRYFVLLQISRKIICVFLELLFFATAALFTGGIIDYCCRSKITMYMIPAFLIGVWSSGFVIRRAGQ